MCSLLTKRALLSSLPELLAKREGAAGDETLTADADGVLGGAGSPSPRGSGPPSPWKGAGGMGMGSSRLDIAGLMARWCHGDANDSDDDGYDGTDGFIDDSEAGLGRVRVPLLIRLADPHTHAARASLRVRIGFRLSVDRPHFAFERSHSHDEHMERVESGLRDPSHSAPPISP